MNNPDRRVRLLFQTGRERCFGRLVKEDRREGEEGRETARDRFDIFYSAKSFSLNSA